jgi:hypothetical protein
MDDQRRGSGTLHRIFDRSSLRLRDPAAGLHASTDLGDLAAIGAERGTVNCCRCRTCAVSREWTSLTSKCPQRAIIMRVTPTALRQIKRFRHRLHLLAPAGSPHRQLRRRIGELMATDCVPQRCRSTIG